MGTKVLKESGAVGTDAKEGEVVTVYIDPENGSQLHRVKYADGSTELLDHEGVKAERAAYLVALDDGD